MVVPLREIGNKHFLSSTKTDFTLDMTLPTMNASGYIGMDFLNAVRNTSDNYDEVKDHTLAPDKPPSRETSISSTVSLVTYHNGMMINSDNDGNAIIEPTNSPQLSYMILGEKNNQVSIVADPTNNRINQCVLIEGMTFNTPQQHVPPEGLALDNQYIPGNNVFEV